MTRATVWPFPFLATVSASQSIIFEAQYPAHQCLCLRFDCHLAMGPAKLGVRSLRYSFPVGLFHSLLHAGLSRRTVSLLMRLR